MLNFILHLTDAAAMKWDIEEEITHETLIIHKGHIRHNGQKTN
jgi:NAD(P) transhydrogenase subunit alpha